MKEKEPKNIGNLKDILNKNINKELFEREDHDELINDYNDEGTDGVYSPILEIINNVFENFVKKSREQKYFFKMNRNSNGHNVAGHMFSIDKLDKRDRWTFEVFINDSGKLEIALMSNSDYNTVNFTYSRLQVDNKSGLYSRMLMTARKSNSVRIDDISLYKVIGENIIEIEVLSEKKKELDQILKDQLEELNNIKELIGNVVYMIDFMEKSKTTIDTLSNIKSNMILESMNESKEDSTVDLKTTINEIINLEL